MKLRQNLAASAVALIAAASLALSPLAPTYALRVNGSVVFNPLTENVVIEFDLQFTQHVSIQILQEGVFYGYLLKDGILTGAQGAIAWREHLEPGDYTPYVFPVPQPFSTGSAIQPFSAAGVIPLYETVEDTGQEENAPILEGGETPGENAPAEAGADGSESGAPQAEAEAPPEAGGAESGGSSLETEDA